MVGRPRAALYCRVSTREQKEGWSLDGQVADLRAYCERRGYDAARLFKEVGSGRTLDRPKLQALVQLALQKRVDVVVLWRPDRLGRRSRDNDFLREVLGGAGVRVESIITGPREDNAYTRFMDRVTDAVDELEAERIAERCQMGRLEAARQGVWPTKPPWGFQRARDGALEPAPEAEALRAAFHAAATQGIRAVRYTLGASRNQTLRRLRNPAYKGTALYAGVTVPVPAIVSPEVWEQANAALDARARAKGKAPRRR